jgi:hypothetical protein
VKLTEFPLLSAYNDPNPRGLQSYLNLISQRAKIGADVPGHLLGRDVVPVRVVKDDELEEKVGGQSRELFLVRDNAFSSASVKLTEFPLLSAYNDPNPRGLQSYTGPSPRPRCGTGPRSQRR